MQVAEKTKGDQAAADRLEKALARLGMQFGWEGEELYILDGEKVTEEEVVVRAIIREKSLQLSLPLLDNPSGEQVGVAFWQEWRRRAEAAFLMVDEDESLHVAARLPIEGLSSKEIERMLPLSLGALVRDRRRVAELMRDVDEQG